MSVDGENCPPRLVGMQVSKGVNCNSPWAVEESPSPPSRSPSVGFGSSDVPHPRPSLSSPQRLPQRPHIRLIPPPPPHRACIHRLPHLELAHRPHRPRIVLKRQAALVPLQPAERHQLPADALLLGHQLLVHHLV